MTRDESRFAEPPSPEEEADDPDQTADDQDDHLRSEDEDDLADPGIPGPSRSV